jgi:NAD-dependent SIR2 family protein deacetylase
MSKIAIFASIATIVASLGIATLSSSDAHAVTPCVTKEFKTELARDACAKGGQPAAKDAMKKFMKEAKIKSCNQCHAKLAPKYELKADAVDQFKKAGGKLAVTK